MAEVFENAPDKRLPPNTAALDEAIRETCRSLNDGKLDPSGQKFAAVLISEYLRASGNTRTYYERRMHQYAEEVADLQAKLQVQLWRAAAQSGKD